MIFYGYRYIEKVSERVWGSTGGKWSTPLIDAFNNKNAVGTLFALRIMEMEGNTKKGDTQCKKHSKITLLFHAGILCECGTYLTGLSWSL